MDRPLNAKQVRAMFDARDKTRLARLDRQAERALERGDVEQLARIFYEMHEIKIARFERALGSQRD